MKPRLGQTLLSDNSVDQFLFRITVAGCSRDLVRTEFGKKKKTFQIRFLLSKSLTEKFCCSLSLF